MNACSLKSESLTRVLTTTSTRDIILHSIPRPGSTSINVLKGVTLILHEARDLLELERWRFLIAFNMMAARRANRTAESY
jgi:hypothetical protein